MSNVSTSKNEINFYLQFFVIAPIVMNYKLEEN